MAMQDTLPVVDETPVRIVKHYDGRLVSVSGAMGASRALARLTRLREINRFDRYEIQPVTITSQFTARRGRR